MNDSKQHELERIEKDIIKHKADHDRLVSDAAEISKKINKLRAIQFALETGLSPGVRIRLKSGQTGTISGLDLRYSTVFPVYIPDKKDGSPSSNQRNIYRLNEITEIMQ